MTARASTTGAPALEFTALFPFSGLGAGALGFLDASVTLFGREVRFRSLGGIDFDEVACADFERLTGSPAWCTSVETITPEQLRARYGERAPDVVFMSPPCQGSSRLLSASKAKTPKYEALNQLALTWARTMLAAWPTPPPLVLLENVPGLPQRAGKMLRELRKLLRAAGYVFHASTHDCGEIGGLAQHRKRYLLVARRPSALPSLLYQPPHRRVRAVGDVLDALPMPATPDARAWGDLHVMPRLSWRNWLRLALIPAGGDWRDLDGVLEGRARREVFRRHAVQRWGEPIPAVTGPGGHSVEAVADPRVEGEYHAGVYGVTSWDGTSPTVTGGANPSKGRFAVADPRVAMPASSARHTSKLHVLGWDDAARTVIGKEGPANGGASVADPRLTDLPQGDKLRVSRAYDAGYGVLRWNGPARTVAGTAAAGTGAYAVADGRDRAVLAEVRVLSLDEAMALDLDPTKPPPFTPVIVAEDGTWHRPLTLLELAVLQGLPAHLEGAPLQLHGTRTKRATTIGNAVPVGAARAIAERMLVTLAEGALGEMTLASSSTPVWVERDRDVRPSNADGSEALDA